MAGGEPRFPVRLGAEPNLRMSEQLVKCVLSGSDPRRHVDVVVFGVVLDGLRWVDPREEVVDLAKDPAVREDLADLLTASADLPDAAPVVRDILGGAASEISSASGTRTQGLAERAEEALQKGLDASVPLFGQRKNEYGFLFTRFLLVRNRLLGIRTDSRRPIPVPMYRTNMELIDLTLRYLARHHIHAIGYFAPIRPIEPGPYEPSDILRFRKDFRSLCAHNGALYFDYSELIPEDMWTNYTDTSNGGVDLAVAGQRDFAHFTGRAHQRLGEQLVKDVRPSFEKWLEEKQVRSGEEGRVARAADALR
jgi:hypothetical protein